MDRIGIYTGVLGFGGIESAVISQLENIDHSSLTYDVIIDDAIVNSMSGKRILALGNRIQSLNVKSGVRFYKLKKYMALYHVIKKNHYHCVHFHFSFPSSLLYGLITRMTGTKSVVTSHASGPAKLSALNKIVQSVSRTFFPWLFTHRIAVSLNAGKWMYGKYSFDVMPNAIDIDKFQFNNEKRVEIRKEFSIPENSIVLGHVGRFVPEKNHLFILEVFHSLVIQKPNSHLILVGDGKNKDDVLRIIYNKRITEKVHVIENTEHVEDYLSAMDCFIFPSVREGFGLVAVEAQANNLPVVASDTIPAETRASELIKFLPLSGDISLWVEAIVQSVNSVENREKSVSSLLKTKYSINNLTESLILYYEK